MRDDRGPWYLLTALVLGVALGVVAAWVVWPVRYVDTSPGSLRADFKDHYRALIAAAYLSNHDLARAQARLLNLYDRSTPPNQAYQDAARLLTIQAQQAVSEGRPESEIQALGQLAVALSQGANPSTLLPTTIPILPSATLTPSPTVVATLTLSPSPLPPIETLTPTPLAVAILTETPLPGTPGTPTRTPRPSATPLPSATSLPSQTATATPGAPFALQSSRLACDQAYAQPLIQVEAQDAAGLPVPGVPVVVSWPGGEDRFYTGLKPELGLGYADFTMTPGLTYILRLGEGGQPVPDLRATECETAGGQFWGAWVLVFAQP
jgi:hypothetical protein